MPSTARRDLGFDRIGRTTRFLAVGAVIAGGVLSAAVAKALPGKSTHRPSTPTAGSGRSSTSGQNSGSGVASGSASGSSSAAGAPDAAVPSGPSLSPPAQAPQPSVSPPVVSSGGS